MPNLIARGQAALVRRMKATDGRAVTYSRAGQDKTLTAWPGNTLFARSTDEPGASVVWGEADYLFAVADWAAAGLGGLPRAGDRVTDPTVLDPANGRPVVFELATPTGEPVVRYSDPTRTVFRVHCKRVPN